MLMLLLMLMLHGRGSTCGSHWNVVVAFLLSLSHWLVVVVVVVVGRSGESSNFTTTRLVGTDGDGDP